MTPEERRARQRRYGAKWRAAHPAHREQLRQRRLAKIAAELPEECETRLAKQNARYQANRETILAQTKARRLANYDEARRMEAEASKRYRTKNLERCRAMDRANKKKNYERNKEAIRAHGYKHKALLRGASVGEPVRHLVVAERDGWRCHICGKKVTRATWSIDHLIPLALGGEHSYANVSLAHNVCNKRRWKGVLPAQLRLMG